MSWFRFLLLIASIWGLFVSVSAHKSTPALYVSNEPDCYTILYKIDDKIFRLEKGMLKESENGDMKLHIIGGLSYMDDMDNKHIVEYWRDGKEFDQFEVKELSEGLNDILKKYD